MDKLEKADSREALLAAGLKLFAQKGLDGTTVKEIAEEAGVNVSLVSYYFQGKDGLFVACLKPFGSSLLATAERVLKPASTLQEFEVRLALFIEEFIDAHLKQSDFTQIIHRDCTPGNPVVRQLFRESFIHVFEAFVRYVAGAKKAGLLRSSVDPVIACGFLMGGLVHSIRMDFIAQEHFNQSIQDPKYREKLTQHVVRQFMQGVSA
jgi:AcrR family transcriptional regulator